jgi:hypothetical protein
VVRASVAAAAAAGMVALPGVAAAGAAPFDMTSCVVWKIAQITAGEELTINGVEGIGIAQSRHDNQAFDNTTVHCVALVKVVPGSAVIEGYCKHLDLDGDIAVGRYVRDGTGKGTWEFLHGTGKWQGITGGGTYEVVAKGRSVTEDTFQSCGRTTGTYTLPK